jgi:hypothetical protein
LSFSLRFGPQKLQEQTQTKPLKQGTFQAQAIVHYPIYSLYHYFIATQLIRRKHRP